MAHHEGFALRILVDVLTHVADQRGKSVEILIGVTAKRSTGKRGPALEVQQLQRVQSLPKTQKNAIAQMIDSSLAAHE